MTFGVGLQRSTIVRNALIGDTANFSLAVPLPAGS
jgi:hypothetical protein